MRRFGLNQTSWNSLHRWEGERKRLGTLATPPHLLSVMLLSSSLRSVLPTNFPACSLFCLLYFLSGQCFPPFNHDISHCKLPVECVAVSPAPQGSIATITFPSLSLSFDR